MPLDTVAICIPVHDEEAELPGLFAALDRLDVESGSLRICLLLDRCSDLSAALCQTYRLASAHRVLLGENSKTTFNAGSARAAAMRLGLASIGDAGLLVTTDADSRPATNWIACMRAGLGLADVVAGRIVRSQHVGTSALQDRIERYYTALFVMRRRLDPVAWEAPDPHHYSGGANMGFRAAAYRALGGFAPLPHGEDARIIDDAERAGLRVRRDGTCHVTTSDRRHGRASGGLALALRRCDLGEAASTLVAHPADAAWQYRLQALARIAFDEAGWDGLAAALGLRRDHVAGVAKDCANATAFAMRIVPVPPGGMRSVTLPEAEAELLLLSGDREAA